MVFPLAFKEIQLLSLAFKALNKLTLTQPYTHLPLKPNRCPDLDLTLWPVMPPETPLLPLSLATHNPTSSHRYCVPDTNFSKETAHLT